MKRITLIIPLIALCNTIYAQYTGIEFTLKANYILVPTKTIEPEQRTYSGVGFSNYQANAPVLKESYNSSVGFEFSARPQFKLNKFSLTTGLGFLYSQYDRDVDVLYDENSFSSLSENLGLLFGGNLIINSGGNSQIIGEPRNGETRMGFITIPVQLDYRLFKKLSVNTSLNLNQLLFARENGMEYGGYDFQTQEYLFNDVVHTDTETFKNTQFTIGFGLSYHIWKQISISALFERSLTDMYEADFEYIEGIRFNRLSLGLTYVISKPINPIAE